MGWDIFLLYFIAMNSPKHEKYLFNTKLNNIVIVWNRISDFLAVICIYINGIEKCLSPDLVSWLMDISGYIHAYTSYSTLLKFYCFITYCVYIKRVQIITNLKLKISDFVVSQLKIVIYLHCFSPWGPCLLRLRLVGDKEDMYRIINDNISFMVSNELFMGLTCEN